MELTTPRLLLRDFRASDHAAVHAFAGDPEVTRYTDWPGMHASREKHQVAD
ncbi:GNAT family N-acetyltransferase [Streptosporangium sandarakinum]|uniref:GNAT family N-acetyltransferase n=1 Tax=Streptosporangium TaxID=2000 RepID=UPI0031F94F0A